MNFLRRISPLTISLGYCLIGSIWLFISNSVFANDQLQGRQHTLIESFQEVAFIFISGLLLFFLLQKYTRQLQKSTQDIKSNEMLYRALLENQGEITGLTDGNGNIKYIGNDATFKAIGYSKEEMIATSVFNFLHPDDLERGNLFHYKIIENPGVLIIDEFRIMHKSGNYIWIEVKAVNRLNDPTINGTVLNVNVIQERKLAEEKLVKGEAKNNAILAAIPDLYFIINNEGRYIYKKPADEYIFTADSDFVGKTIFDVLPEDLAKKAWINMRQAFETNQVQVFEYQAVTDKGRQCIETRMNKLSENEVLVMVRNITEKYNSEQKIKKSEALFRSTFEQAAVGIVHVGLDFKRIRINDRFCQIVGRTKEELYSSTIRDVAHPSDYETEDKLIQQLLDNEIEYYKLEKRYIKDNGSIIWTDLTVSLVRDEEGRPDYFIAVIQDISHKKQMEQALEYKNQELNTFIYRASHDLRGPIASLIGLGRIAKSELKDPDALKFMKKVLITSYKLDDILQSLIDITKIQQGVIKSQPLNFEHKVHEILSNLENLDSFGRICFNKEINYTGEFCTDSSLIRSILQNLFENAIKYSKVDGDAAKVWINITEAENGVEIKVRDNGIGIKKEAQEKVFNMFYRATEKSRGSGLGLYIVKCAIEKLGGKISLYSEENLGTEFHIFIPESRVLQLADQ